MLHGDKSGILCPIRSEAWGEPKKFLRSTQVSNSGSQSCKVPWGCGDMSPWVSWTCLTFPWREGVEKPAGLRSTYGRVQPCATWSRIQEKTHKQQRRVWGAWISWGLIAAVSAVGQVVNEPSRDVQLSNLLQPSDPGSPPQAHSAELGQGQGRLYKRAQEAQG